MVDNAPYSLRKTFCSRFFRIVDGLPLLKAVLRAVGSGRMLVNRDGVPVNAGEAS